MDEEIPFLGSPIHAADLSAVSPSGCFRDLKCPLQPVFDFSVVVVVFVVACLSCEELVTSLYLVVAGVASFVVSLEFASFGDF